MLFNKFPRDFSVSRKVVKDEKKFINLINKNNGIRDCYSSIYSFELTKDEKLNYNTCHIDKIFFDFDIEQTKPVLALHTHLKKENLKHIVIFSGRGFHIYIFTKISELKYPKSAVRNAQMRFINKLNLYGWDEKIIGDIVRISRIPNTWNLKRKRYCIPISTEDLEKGYDYIKERAKEQNFNFTTYGELLLNLNKFDYGHSDTILLKVDFDKISQVKLDEVMEKKTPVCIRRMLGDGNCGWVQRYLLITFFRDGLAFMRNETIAVLKKYLSYKKFTHCVKEERQVDYLYRRPDLFFSCQKMRLEGMCPFKEKICKIGKEIYE